jgi:hypothetical protein
MVVLALGGEKEQLLFTENRILVLQDKEFRRLDAQQCQCTLQEGLPQGPGVVVLSYNPSYTGGVSRRITL